MEQIHLKGGKIHYTEDSNTAYKVTDGQVLAFLMPVKEGKKGRRMLLGEFDTGNVILGFHFASESLGEWIMGLVAVDTAELSAVSGDIPDSMKSGFAETIGITLDEFTTYEEMIIEKYELMNVKEQGYIYAAQMDQERTRDRSLRLIFDLFKPKRRRGVTGVFTETGSHLYDAAAYICRREKIDIASLDRITETSGRNYRISDVARLSHFVIREIVLEPGWHHKDTGTVLAFTGGGKHPVACIPRNTHSYYIYNPAEGTTEPLTDEIAKTLDPTAWMFYRPFPEKELNRRDLFRFGMQKVSKADLARLLIMTLIGTLIGLLLPYLNEQAYDKFIPMGNASGLIQLGAVILACALGNVSFTIVKNLASFRSMNTMEYAVQSATFDRLFNLPESFFRKYDAADIGQRAMGITTIYTVLAQSAVTSFLSALFSLLYLWRMFKYSKSMSVWALVMLLAVSVFILVMGIMQLRHERKKHEVDIAAQSVVFQLLYDVGKLRMAYAEDRALQRYMEKSVESRRIGNISAGYSNAVSVVAGAAQIVFSMVFFYIMIHNSIGLTIGEFSAFSAAFGSLSGAFLTIVQNYLTINNIRPLYEHAKPILDELPETSQDADLPGDIDGDIEINNVTFTYDEKEPPVLHGLSLHIKAGEYVGIVGSSGCGKSTLLKLMLGFEKPQSGGIYYDNHDINDLDKRELRKKFGVVLQNGGLITGSIYENITIAAPGVKIKRVEETIREVGLEEDIKKMPMGLHTVIAEGAGTISGGQAQRILIARAIVGKPKVVFLDEATSALDNVTQRQIVDTLERLDATKVVIAHRLSTVQNCDRILVMDKGDIVEQGTFEQLMEKKGLFYELAKRQMA